VCSKKEPGMYDGSGQVNDCNKLLRTQVLLLMRDG
jgi:hypothetical protein